jgi:hypothetical protein
VLARVLSLVERNWAGQLDAVVLSSG